MAGDRGDFMDFYEQLSRVYDTLFQAGQKQLLWIDKNLRKKGRILDVGAGTGTYTMPLIQLGYQVIALEPDKNMMMKLKNKQIQNKFNIESVLGGMADISDFENESFDGILCIGNTLPHLSDKYEVKKVLKSMCEKLKPNGILLVQIVNYDYIYGKKIDRLPTIERPQQNLRFERLYRFIDKDRIEFKGRLITTSSEDEKFGNKEYITEAVTDLLGIKKIFLQDVFASIPDVSIQIYGDFNESPWTEEKKATVVVARKKL